MARLALLLAFRLLNSQQIEDMKRKRHRVALNGGDVRISFARHRTQQDDVAVFYDDLDIGAASPEIARQQSLQSSPGARPDLHVRTPQRQHVNVVDNLVDSFD